MWKSDEFVLFSEKYIILKLIVIEDLVLCRP
jgi:hypothetical protein